MVTLRNRELARATAGVVEERFSPYPCNLLHIVRWKRTPRTLNQKDLCMLWFTGLTDSSEGSAIAPIRLLEFSESEGEAPDLPEPLIRETLILQ